MHGFLSKENFSLKKELNFQTKTCVLNTKRAMIVRVEPCSEEGNTEPSKL